MIKNLCFLVLSILAILVLFQFFYVDKVSANDSYSGHIAIGKEYLMRGSYNRAVREFTGAIKSKPRNSLAYIERGTAYNQMGNYKSAITDFTKAIELDSKNYLAFNNRGVANFRQGELKNALADFNQAINLNKKSPFARLNYAGAALASKTGSKGAKELDSWLTENNWKGKYSGHAAVLSILGYKQSKDSAKANAMLVKALKKVNRLEWPYPVLNYLNGKLKQEELIESAKESDYDATQAHCFIALNELNSNNSKLAQENLNWIAKYGTKNSVEYWLCKNLLKKNSPGK